jgi:lipoprotein-anchoring transpeptidase ErfK/SrfK
MADVTRRGLVAVGFGVAGMVAGTGSAEARRLVPFDAGQAGVIVIRNRERALYLTLGQGSAVRYPIAVGRVGKSWTGATAVENLVPYPHWQPPAIVRRDLPHLPAVVPPGPRNPLGTRAIVLARPEYAIHGTNDPASIGRAASYGCFRMFNHDVEDLFARVRIGTPVVVMA